MNKYKYILKRELEGYFNSMIAYIFITIFLILENFFFFRTFFINGSLTMRSFFEITPWIFLFFIPSITMRLWAEEKKTGTNELLFTMPISEWDIVIGKFFGALIFIAIAILLTINIPITLLILGNADIGPIIGGYLGLVFVAAAFISVGLFASTTTANQIIAYIVGAVICFLFFMLGQQFIIFNLSASIAKMFTFLSISTHFASISRGVLDFIDIVYYIGFTSIFLWLGYIMIKKRV